MTKALQPIEIRLVEGRPMVSSLKVAEHFGKPHKDVLKAIKNLEIPEDFSRRNFSPTSYKDAQGKERPAYLMTRDGFVLLAMGFTGKKAMEWKIKYIEAFNKMEKALKLIAEEKAKEVEGKPSRVEAKQVEQKETPEIEHKEVISSLDVAKAINVKHAELLKRIRKVKAPNFSQCFIPSFYTIPGNFKKYPMFLITKEGLSLLVSRLQVEEKVKILLKMLEDFDNKKTKELASSAGDGSTEMQTLQEMSTLSDEVRRKVNELKESVRKLNSVTKKYCWSYHKYQPGNPVSITLKHFWEIQDEVLHSLDGNLHAIDSMSRTILRFAKEMPSNS